MKVVFILLFTGKHIPRLDPRNDHALFAVRCNRHGGIIPHDAGFVNTAADTSPSNSRTRARTLCAASTFLMSSNTSEIMSAIAAISASFMPRVVTAGVPSRDAAGLNGERVSEWNRVLVDRDARFVEPQSGSPCRSRFFAPTSTSIQMIVRAAADEPVAVAFHAISQRRGVLQNLLLIIFWNVGCTAS